MSALDGRLTSISVKIRIVEAAPTGQMKGVSFRAAQPRFARSPEITSRLVLPIPLP